MVCTSDNPNSARVGLYCLRMELGFAAVYLLVVSLLGVDGFPDGAPSSECSTMQPLHNDHVAENSPPPYQITTSSTTYAPGQSISG